MQQDIDKEVRKFGKKLAVYLKANLEEALDKGRKGKGSPMEADLHFEEVISQTPDGIKVQLVAMSGGKSVDYWAYIEHGVNSKNTSYDTPFKFKKKAIDFDAVGKKWQNKNNINPQKVLLEIEAKYRKSSRLSVVNNKLTRVKKKLSYDEAAYKLSKYFAFAIARDGLTPKPYVQQAIKEAKVDEFQKRISEIMGKDIRIQLELNTVVKPIKLNF